MQKQINWMLLIICFLLGVCLGLFIDTNRQIDNANEKYIVNDTIYNTITLDSIRYNIIVIDSTIIEIKKNVRYEIEQAINANDSDAVEQFKALAGTR